MWFFLALGTARGDEQDTHVCGPLSFELDGVVHEFAATRTEAPAAAAAFARRMGPAFAGGGCAPQPRNIRRNPLLWPSGVQTGLCPI